VDTVSGPSEKAQQAAYAATQDFAGMIPLGTLALTFEATHDPALGLDRSVCLRDVVERVRREEGAMGYHDTADFIEREFGGGA
jgi:hypothetical protein